MISRKGIQLRTKLFVLITILSIVPTIMLVNGENYQINSYFGSESTIDGFIDIAERDSTSKPEKLIVPFDTWYVGGGDHLPREVEVGSFHTNNSNLYINTKIEYDGIVAGNITYYLRKNGTDDYYDLKKITSVTNNCVDGFRIPNDWQYHIDSDNGGTEDSEGKCHLTESSLTFELLIPYNSNDTTGHDVNVTLNDEIEIRFSLRIMYLNESQEEWNYYTWSSTDSWAIVFQNTTAAPESYIGIFLGIIVIASFRMSYKRLKRRNSK